MTAASIRWGILGTSPISATMAKAIHASTTSQLLAIGSRAQHTAEQFAATHGIPKAYDRFDALLADPEVQAIYIGLPNHLHKEWILRCAAAGKHILCDKPFVTSLAEAEEIFTALRDTSVFFMEGLMYRCHPFIAKLRELFQQKMLGDIRHYSATYMADIVGVANPTIGGSILTLGCYPVSLILMLAGIAQQQTTALPVAMTALGRLDAQDHNDRHASVLLQFADHSSATITVADDAGMFVECSVYGTRGSLHFKTNPWMPTATDNVMTMMLQDQSTSKDIIVSAEKPLYTYEIDVMNAQIRAGQRAAAEMSWEDSLATMTVMSRWREMLKEVV